MNQNENNPITAEGILDNLYRYVNKDINDDAAWDIAMQKIEEYTAQQVKLLQDYLEATVKNRADVVADMKNRLKQVTEERDKAVDLLDESRVQLQYLDKRFPTGTTPNVLGRIETLLNSLNAAGSDTGKK